MNLKSKNEKVVMVSGGFDPIHIGHIRLMQEAKKLGDKLIVGVLTDVAIMEKKPRPTMSFDERFDLWANDKKSNRAEQVNFYNLKIRNS